MRQAMRAFDPSRSLLMNGDFGEKGIKVILF